MAAAAIGTSALAAEREEAQIYRVVGVADGDTLTAVNGKRQIKCRLYGIDAPERHQVFGKRSKQALSDLGGRHLDAVRLLCSNTSATEAEAVMMSLTENSAREGMHLCPSFNSPSG